MKKPTLIAIAGYGLLSILFTWPTAAQITTAIPGDGFDGWQNYWNQWWIKEALLVKQTHFFFTDILYPPAGASLLFHTLNFFNGLFTLPIQLNFGLTVAYNAVVFFHFTLSGFGVFLLAQYSLARLGLARSWVGWSAAFIAGIIFTFSPFHMAHLLGHMQVFSLTWPPFYILWVVRMVDRWRLNPAQSLPRFDLGVAGLFLIFITMIDWYHTLYMVLFTAIVLLWAWGSLLLNRQRPWHALWKPFAGLAGMGLVFGLLFSPLIVPMAAEASTADYMRPTFAENVILSADLLAFFTPSELHPIWGEWVLPIYQTFTTTTSERLIFAGFIPLALAIYGAFRFRRKRLVQFWLIFTIIFFILALGPYLHIGGEIIQMGDQPLPMPYLFLYKIVPFIGISRSLSRFDLMVMIGLGVLAAMGAARLRPRWQIPLAALICFEFLAIPYPMSQIDTPAFFKQIAQEAEHYTIAALPMNWDRPTPLLYQTVHGKDLLTAYTSRQNPLDLSWRTPVFQQWRTLSDDIIKTDLATVAPTIFHDFQLKYIVLDYFQMPPGPERDGTEKWVEAALPNHAPIYQDDRLTVYQAPAMIQRVPYLQLGADWGSLNQDTGYPSRLMNEDALLTIIGDNGNQVSIVIETMPPYSLAGFKASSTQAEVTVSISEDNLQAIVTGALAGQQLQLQVPTPLPIIRLELQELSTP